MERHNNSFSARFFHAVYYNTIIKENWQKVQSYSFCKFSEDELIKLLIDSFPECNYQELKNHIRWFIARFSKSELNFYDVLFAFSRHMIVRYENQYCFRYKYADTWRSLTKEIGEEIFVVAAVAQIDWHRGISDRMDFDWSPCIEHDNSELKMLLKRDNGVSENHFHLRASSSYFELSWVFLMNDISSQKYEVNIRSIERELLKLFPSNEGDFPLVLIWRKAAAIRLFLYLLLTNSKEAQKNYYTLLEQQVLPYQATSICTFPITEIEERIHSINKTGTIDYAHQHSRRPHEKYFNLSGERYILYHCLNKILKKNENYQIIEQYLFLYMLLKHKFYAEMVQSNDRIGFYNFNQYQRRKDYFIPWDNEKTVATETICSMIENNKIYRAELRISPEPDCHEMTKIIELYDSAIDEALKLVGKQDTMKRDLNFFYTLHFVKLPDKLQQGFCRHQLLREDNEKKARMIFDLRCDIAQRIYGIDACGEEIDCRPEVFAPIFRYLQNYDSERIITDGRTLHQLKATYHVGEDNYDIADGLRAIDEAITFLNLRSGCRFGHATLLGISPYDYYSENKNTVSMPCQVFLDNMVWMYFFIRENSIKFDDISHLITYLQEKFNFYFAHIYDHAINSERINDLLKDALCSPYFHLCAAPVKLNKDNCYFGLHQYYDSYLLRGDEPRLYRDGFISERCLGTEGYQLCHTKEEMENARSSFEASYLYYLYHYNEQVKIIGTESITEVLPDYFIEGVALVQNKLKEKISREGIYIETNPTSNLFISSIKDYSQHPIHNFYDNGLKKEPGNLQLNVSINTDDKSVFSTCLSNEYAYLLFYLEQKKDSDGNQMYSRFEIMRWLDDIRKMGNEQSFANE